VTTIVKYFSLILNDLSKNKQLLMHSLVHYITRNEKRLMTIPPPPTPADKLPARNPNAPTTLGPALHLLLTTRLAQPTGANWLTLGELPDHDAMDLLEKHRPFADLAEREAARRIVRKLGGFAMAVELVAAWLAAHEGSTYRSIANTIGLEDLETIAEDETAELRRHNHERRLTAVLEPVLASLNEVERQTMDMAAFLPPDTVTRRMETRRTAPETCTHN